MCSENTQFLATAMTAVDNIRNTEHIRAYKSKILVQDVHGLAKIIRISDGAGTIFMACLAYLCPRARLGLLFEAVNLTDLLAQGCLENGQIKAHICT